MLAPRRAWVLAALYAAALVYLSLLPFEFKPQTLAEAWERFRAIPFLALGLLDRADWIANLVAYIPLGFLLAAALDGRGRRALAFVGATAMALVLAVAIEFTQLFFAPRTVSLNDLVAELIGAAAGAAAWPLLARRLDAWAHEVRAGGGRATLALLWAYAVGYVLISLFPYDFLMNAAELGEKIRSGAHGWLFAPGECGALTGCTLKLAAEVLAVAPIGWLLASYGGRLRARLGTGLAAGALLGIALEAAQFLIASGQTQGASVLARASGVALGVLARRVLPALGVEGVVRAGRILSIAGIVPYLALLAFAAGWFGARPMGFDEALARLPTFGYLPFHYHYFSTEARAVASAVTYAALYAPVGVAAWLWLRGRAGGAAIGAVLAAVLALAVEFSKALLPGKHPDVTDALIAAVSAWLAFRALEIATSAERAISPAQPSSAGETGPPAAEAPQPARAGSWTLAAILGAIVALSVLGFPAFRAPLALGLLAYAALLAWRPQAWLVALPALVPVLDLAPWTGRFFWDELDLFVLATLAVRAVAGPPPGAGTSRLPGAKTAAVVLGCAAASALLGVLPLEPLDANAFASYYSHYNALRVLKGVAWACALFLLLRRDAAAGFDALALLAKGLVAGLALAAVAIAWERATFTGLFDAAADYRVTGLFSAMHVGGAYAESFVIAALPFALHAALLARTTAGRVAGAAAAVAGCYALAVTFSRTAYVAVAVEALVFGGVLLATRSARAGGRRLVLGLGAAAGAVLVGLVAVPVAMGPYASARFTNAPQDIQARASHWTETVRLFRPEVATVLFGMGLGTFPERFLWGGPPAARPGTLRFLTESGNTYLRLGSGQPLYVDQFVAFEPGTPHQLSVDLRRSGSDADVAIGLCEKLILYSRDCAWLEVPAGRALDSGWARIELPVHGANPGGGAWPFARPVKVTIHKHGRDGHVDVDNVSLRTPGGAELLRNGDFSAGLDRWLFAANDFWPWHIDNLLLHVGFEQGIAGVLVLLAVLGIAAGRLWLAPRDDGLQAAFLAAIAGLVAMGALNSVINAPRLALVFWLLLLASLLATAGRAAASSRKV